MKIFLFGIFSLLLIQISNCEERQLFLVVSAKGLISGDTDSVHGVISDNFGSTFGTKYDASHSDPYVKMYSSNRDEPAQQLIDVSNTLKDNNNPVWNKFFNFNYKSGTGQKWHFFVYDSDALDEDDQIGVATVDVDEYVSRKEEITENLSGGGTITVKKLDSISFKLSARNLPALDSVGGLKSDPYVKVYFKEGADGKESKLYETTVVDNVKDVDWEDLVAVNSYTRGKDQQLKFKIKDSDIGRDTDIGEAVLDLDSFVSENKPKTFNLVGGGTFTVTPA